jgi:hypothetical protein
MQQQDLTQEILSRLDTLAAKLGTTVEYLWPALVREQYAIGLAYLCTIGVFLAATGVCWAFVLRGKQPFFLHGDPTPRVPLSIAACILSLVALAIVGALLPPALGQVIAPEAAALRSVLP